MSGDRKKHCIIIRRLFLILVFILSGRARADLFSSWGILENNSGTPVTSQLSVDVTPYGGEMNQVLFTVSNEGPVASSITDIYFDDGALLGIASIINGPGVNFGFPAKPGNLPGGENADPDFETSGSGTSYFSADSEPSGGVMANGVNPGESVGIVFDLQGENENGFDDVIDALYVGFRPDLYYDYDTEEWLFDNLRIGIHVQGIYPSGKSDAYLLTPIPAAVFLELLGLSLIAGWKLRRFA